MPPVFPRANRTSPVDERHADSPGRYQLPLSTISGRPRSFIVDDLSEASLARTRCHGRVILGLVGMVEIQNHGVPIVGIQTLQRLLNSIQVPGGTIGPRGSPGLRGLFREARQLID